MSSLTKAITLPDVNGNPLVTYNLLFLSLVEARKGLQLSSEMKARRKLLHDFLASVPSEVAIVNAVYHQVDNRVVHLNNPNSERNKKMDLFNLFGNSKQKDPKLSDLPVRLVCPAPAMMPEDGHLHFALITNVADVMTSSDTDVMCFKPENFDLLAVVAKNPAMFGFRVEVLDGVERADYSVDFRGATLSLNVVSYTSLIANLVESKRTADLLADERATPAEKEMAQFTRKDGTVRPYTNYSALSKDSVDHDTANEQ